MWEKLEARKEKLVAMREKLVARRVKLVARREKLVARRENVVARREERRDGKSGVGGGEEKIEVRVQFPNWHHSFLICPYKWLCSVY